MQFYTSLKDLANDAFMSERGEKPLYKAGFEPMTFCSRDMHPSKSKLFLDIIFTNIAITFSNKRYKFYLFFKYLTPERAKTVMT